MPPWSKLLERPRPGLILISRCKTLARARGFRGSVSCSFIPSCLAGDSGGGFCESRVPAALGGTSERRPHPSRPFRIPFVLSIFFSTWWSPVSGARGDDERRQRLFRLISLLLRFENCGPLFYQPRVHSLGRQRAARAARCDCARHVVSTPVFLGRGGGCQGTSCLLSLLPFRLLPLVLPRLPVAVRRRRDWRRGGRNYRREWRTAAINPRRQVFRG